MIHVIGPAVTRDGRCAVRDRNIRGKQTLRAQVLPQGVRQRAAELSDGVRHLLRAAQSEQHRRDSAVTEGKRAATARRGTPCPSQTLCRASARFSMSGAAVR